MKRSFVTAVSVGILMANVGASRAQVIPSSVAASSNRYVAYSPPLFSPRGPAPSPSAGGIPVRTPLAYVAYNPPLFTGRAPAVAPYGFLTTNEPATIEVLTPVNAEIWFDGHKTSQTGARRLFATPVLDKDQGYHYEVRVRRWIDGKPIEESRIVSIRSGERITLAFPGPK
jgi:uncharacterized protein (TIGR03000 family)